MGEKMGMLDSAKSGTNENISERAAGHGFWLRLGAGDASFEGNVIPLGTGLKNLPGGRSKYPIAALLANRRLVYHAIPSCRTGGVAGMAFQVDRSPFDPESGFEYYICFKPKAEVE